MRTRSAPQAAQEVRPANFSGYWVLDHSRSDAPTSHLESLGLPSLATQAGVKMAVTMSILHGGASGKAWEVSQDIFLGDLRWEKSRAMVIGEEYKEHARDGGNVRMTPVQTAPNQISTTIDWGNAKLYETKTLDGDTLVQEIEMQMKTSATSTKTTKTRRVFVRSMPPAPT